MNRVSPKVLALLGALTLVWGTNWPLFKIALDELPVLTFRAIVLVTATLVLLAVLLVRGESFAIEVTPDLFEFIEGVYEPPEPAELAGAVISVSD